MNTDNIYTSECATFGAVLTLLILVSYEWTCDCHNTVTASYYEEQVGKGLVIPLCILLSLRSVSIK
jgi:hypothetical protein